LDRQRRTANPPGARLQTVADVEGRPVSEVVREAIATLVEQRRTDERFLRLLEDNLARHKQALDLLRGDAGPGPSAFPGVTWGDLDPEKLSQPDSGLGVAGFAA
jgi:hypothetical protein